MTVAKVGDSDHLKEHWDQLWGETNGDAYTVEERISDPNIGIRNSVLFEEVVNCLNNRGTPVILEAGCGQAIWVIALLDLGFNIVGIDYSINGLTAAAKYRDGLPLVTGNILRLPFRDLSFDAMLSWGVVEHFQDPSQLSSVLEETYRALRSNGDLLITVPVDNFVLRARRLLRHMPGLRYFARPDPPFFERKFRVNEFLGLLRETGFGISMWRYHATEFGLAVTCPGVFQKDHSNRRYLGLNWFGKVVHAGLISWLPLLTAHQIFVLAHKRDN